MMWTKAITIGQIYRNLEEDEFYFDDMIDEANKKGLIRSWVRFQPSASYITRLRARSKRKPQPVKGPRSILEDDPADGDELDEPNDSATQQRAQEEGRRILRSAAQPERQDTERRLSKKQRRVSGRKTEGSASGKRSGNVRGARKAK